MSYIGMVELIRNVEPFCRDAIGQYAALDHLGVVDGFEVLSVRDGKNIYFELEE